MIKKAIGIALLALFCGLPAGAANRPSKAAVDRILKKAYMTLASYTAGAGRQVSFRITDQKFIKVQDFDHVLWVDVATMPGGNMVDMAREVRSYDGAAVAVLYRPSWSAAAENYLDTPEGRDLAVMSVAEVLAALRVEQPEFREVTGVSSYQVEVELDGRSRSYRAAILWFPDPHGRYARISFLDHITQGVENAALERPLRPRPPLDLDALEKDGKFCRATSKNTTRNQIQTGREGHLLRFDGTYDGWHIAEVSTLFSCECASDCSQTCTPTFNYAICADSGNTYGMCHKMVSTAALETRSSDDASSISAGGTGGQGCAAGFGCVMKASPFCFSVPSVSVNISGLNISFQVSGSPDWDRGNLKFTHTCSSCTLESSNGGTPGNGGPYNQDPGGPGGNPSGGGNNCCAWRTTCYVSSSGQYTCTPTATCAVWGC